MQYRLEKHINELIHATPSQNSGGMGELKEQYIIRSKTKTETPGSH